MFTKLRAIARKDVYTTFKDRNAMLYMFAMPLGLSLIIGLAFGGSSGDVTIDAVPVAVANHDTGATLPGGTALVLGQTYQEAFVPTGNAAQDGAYKTIHELTKGQVAADLTRTRRQVEDGDLAALIQVPPDFSTQVLEAGGSSAIHVYYDSGQSVGPSIVISIVRDITNGINTVILAQRVGPGYLLQLGATLGKDQAEIQQAAAQVSGEAISNALNPPIQMQAVDLQGKTRSVDALQYFAPSMAILFMTFAMASGATSILTERRRWTLQRIITTPTPRWLFMGGKLAGTYITGVAQMIILMITTVLVARIMGRNASLWGSNYVGIALMTLAVVFTATSLGLVIAALSQTPDQASTYSTVALFLLGMLGGSFIQIQGLPTALSWLPKVTLNYWGIQGFFSLSYYNASVPRIGTNLIALVLMGVVFFALSLWRFSRRLDI
jgi:ABC-2 type transport system permease protein